MFPEHIRSSTAIVLYGVRYILPPYSTSRTQMYLPYMQHLPAYCSLPAYLPICRPYLLPSLLPCQPASQPAGPPACRSPQIESRHTRTTRTTRTTTPCAPSLPTFPFPPTPTHPILWIRLARGGLLSIIRGSTCIVRGTYANDSMSQASRTILLVSSVSAPIKPHPRRLVAHSAAYRPADPSRRIISIPAKLQPGT